MTFYDDAEFAAFRLASIAAAETEDDPKSAEMCEVANDMFQRHGQDCVYVLTMAGLDP